MEREKRLAADFEGEGEGVHDHRSGFFAGAALADGTLDLGYLRDPPAVLVSFVDDGEMEGRGRHAIVILTRIVRGQRSRPDWPADVLPPRTAVRKVSAAWRG